MKVNFDTPLVSPLDNKPIHQSDAADSAPALLKHVAIIALQAPAPNDDAAKKMRCFELMVAANAGGVQHVSAEDVALIKEKIGAAYGPLIVGVSFRALEQQG